MAEQHTEFPADIFRREYPEHATRVAQAVTHWYQLAVNQYITGGPQLLRENTANFFRMATSQPEDVFIGGMPLSFTSDQKRDSMLEKFKQIPPAVYVAKFGNWFNSHLTNDKVPATRKHIEHTAQSHILNWLGGLNDELKQAQGVWQEVDSNLTAISEGKTNKLHPVSSVLLSCVNAAVVEQFMTDEYAPKDLFGPVTISQ